MKASFKNTFASLVLAALAGPVTGHAALIYDEEDHGELRGQQLDLGIGVNTISGTTGYSTAPNIDAFNFTVPENARLDNITIVGTVLDSFYFDWLLVNDDEELVEVISFRFDSAGTITKTLTSTPLPSGFYYIWFSYLANCGPSCSMDYTFSLAVSPTGTTAVPEPGTLALLGLGLVGIGMRRRIKAS